MDRLTGAALRLTQGQRHAWVSAALERAERARSRADARIWVAIAESVRDALTIESEAIEAHSVDAAEAEKAARARHAAALPWIMQEACNRTLDVSELPSDRD